jgi:hypothetical protein
MKGIHLIIFVAIASSSRFTEARATASAPSQQAAVPKAKILRRHGGIKPACVLPNIAIASPGRDKKIPEKLAGYPGPTA